VMAVLELCCSVCLHLQCCTMIIISSLANVQDLPVQISTSTVSVAVRADMCRD
jgi:hypothetical protein